MLGHGADQGVWIVCFSGTGGAKRVALAFERELKERGLAPRLTALEGPGAFEAVAEKPGLLLLVFAVHAFDAPGPVYAWAESADLSGVCAAVVSVSGGGEAWPNTGCRNGIVRALEARGARVVYEKMVVMPCNWVVPVGDEAAMQLLCALPEKV